MGNDEEVKGVSTQIDVKAELFQDTGFTESLGEDEGDDLQILFKKFHRYKRQSKR